MMPCLVHQSAVDEDEFQTLSPQPDDFLANRAMTLRRFDKYQRHNLCAPPPLERFSQPLLYVSPITVLVPENVGDLQTDTLHGPCRLTFMLTRHFSPEHPPTMVEEHLAGRLLSGELTSMRRRPRAETS